MVAEWNRPWSRRPGVLISEPSAWSGERMKALRTRYGLSQEQMGAVLGTSRVSITNWEKGAGPEKQSLCRLLDLLEAHPEMFWEEAK